MQVNAEFAGGGVHHAQALGHHFFANAVSWNHGNPVLGHGNHFLLQK
jgi:hypothetical protein